MPKPMNLSRLKALQVKINQLKQEWQALEQEANAVRSHYKHQSSDLDSYSESFIVSYANGDLEGASDYLTDLVSVVEEDEG